MQPLYLRWHNKAELKRVLHVLQERGYRNVSDLTAEYSFPVIAVDCERKIFYESHIFCSFVTHINGDFRSFLPFAFRLFSNGLKSPFATVACACL